MDYLFGESYSSFKYKEDTIEMPYSTLEADYSIPSEIEHQSIITGARHFVDSKDYSSFIVTVNLFKYPEPNIYAAKLMKYAKKLVKFAPHNFGVVKNNLSKEIDFYISSVVPFFLTSLEEYSGVVLFFTSVEPTTVMPLFPYIITENTEQQILTEGGESIIIE